LQRDWIDVVLRRDVADDRVRAGELAGDALHTLAAARDKRDARAAPGERAHQREAQPGRAARDADAQSVQSIHTNPPAPF